MLCSESHPPMRATRSGCRFEDHAVALPLKRVQGAPPGALGMTAVVIVLAELVIDRLPREEVVHHDEDGVGHGDDRLLGSGGAHDPSVAGGESAPAMANSAERGFGKRSAQPGRTFPRPPGAVFSCALVIARTEPRPAGQVGGALS